MELQDLSVIAFITKNQVKTETGDILDFKKYRFMYDVYRDRSRLMVCMKSAQIGFTTYEIIKTAHECKNEGIDILYVLPTADDVKRFSGGKTNKILSQNPVMATWTQDKDSVEQKQFGEHTVYYQGSWTERAALMITAKKLVVDEYDRCKQSIVEMYDSRLQSIADPKKAFFSNPSIPDFGVHKFYQLSDQKKWHVTHSCSANFVLDEGCIDYEQELYICPSCKGEITDEERRMGEWKSTSEGEWSGYWIPLWVAPWMKASDIAKYKREKTGEYFANFVAGEPYVGSGNVVTEEMLVNAISPLDNTQKGRTIIGVDTGHNIYYTLMNKEGVFYHGYIMSVEENERSLKLPNYNPYDALDKLMRDYPEAIMVADQGGDLIGIRALQAKYPSRVFLCWFTKETKNQQIIRWSEGEERGRVLVDRNRMIQLTVDEIADKRLTFNGSYADWKDYFAHWMNIYRAREIVDETEPSYGWRWVWKRKGPDHWALSTVYARVGLDKYQDSKATIIGQSGLDSIELGLMDTDYNQLGIRNAMQNNNELFL
jgi:hypothetical protein